MPQVFRHTKLEQVAKYTLFLLTYSILFTSFFKEYINPNYYYTLIVLGMIIAVGLYRYSSIRCRVIITKNNITKGGLFKTIVIETKNIIGFDTDKQHIILITDTKRIAIEKRLKEQNGLTFALFIRANYNYIGEN